VPDILNEPTLRGIIVSRDAVRFTESTDAPLIIPTFLIDYIDWEALRGNQ